MKKRLYLATLLLAHSASAVELPFGSHGLTAVSGAIQFQRLSSGSMTTAGQAVGDATLYWLTFSPSLMYFAAEHFAVGAQIGLGRQWSSAAGTGSVTLLTLQPVVGYDVPLSEAFSIFPQVGAYLQFQISAPGAGQGPTQTDRHAGPSLYLPLVIHPASNFFAGLGPSVMADVYAKGNQGIDRTKSNVFALQSVLGGYF